MESSSTDSPSPTWLAPVLANEHYVWRRGDLAFVVDPRKGARLTEASLGGHNLLTGPDVNAQNYGSTIWTSPQVIWGWPPPPELDELPYEASLEEGRLVCRGTGSARLGVSLTKEFAVDERTGVLVMRTTAHNLVRVPCKLALWEISRVATGGLTFFPKGEGLTPASKLVVLEKAGLIWFPYDAKTITEHQKVFADGQEGWLGHVDVSAAGAGHGALLLVKTFPKVPRAAQAPGEAEIELYADPGHTYVEVEQQGPYVLVPPHGSTSWEVRWSLARVPAGIAVEPGNAALVELARGLAHPAAPLT